MANFRGTCWWCKQKVPVHHPMGDGRKGGYRWATTCRGEQRTRGTQHLAWRRRLSVGHDAQFKDIRAEHVGLGGREIGVVGLDAWRHDAALGRVAHHGVAEVDCRRIGALDAAHDVQHLHATATAGACDGARGCACVRVRARVSASA